uniref:Laminin G domain-containing protein n=1 Tax=Ciona savignyi TaxID=51511 RepID=H2YI76_CIOSA
ASFYGNSFLFERLSDNSADTTLSLQFQTRALDGIILIAAGQRDYLIVSLKHGRLEIRINTGYGEEVLKTTSKEKYNNLLWHEVQLIRHAHNVWVDVNKKNIITSTLQAGNREYNLNIDLGVFLGGFDRNVGSSYVGKLEQFFRGCILSAVYNDVDVLDPIMSVGNHKFAHNVDAGCSNIFRAQPNQPMSFTSAESFLKLPTWPTSDDEALFECRLRTLGQDGLIMFSSGATRSEFVMLELSKGHIRGSINRGSGVVALQSTTHVNDGGWHRVRLKLTSSNVGIIILHEYLTWISNRPPSGDLDMTGGMYIGGMDRGLKQQMRSSGIQTQSFPGCFKNLRVNRIRKTFKDFTSTHLLNVGCPSNMTTLPHAQSSSQVVPNFVIVPHTQPRTSHKPSSTMVTRGQQRHVCFQQIIHNIELMEGGRVDLSDEIIRFDLMSDERRLRNDNSMQFLTFNLTQPALHGGLVMGGQGVVGGDALVMQDIHDGKLTYVHDGSETRTDRIEYHLCNAHHDTIPPSMKYSLNITIIPVDDPPVLSIPANYTFTPIRNARTPLPTHILRSYDPDSDPSDIIYHVLSGGVGWHIASTVRPVDSFTQTQVDRGEVDFVHANGPDRVRLLVQVTNSNATLLSSTSTYVMRISTKPIQITVSHSRGLVLVEGEAKLITLQQLNVSTNAGAAHVDVKYRVVSPPLYGHIQVSSGVWSRTDHFFQSHLRDNQLRYLNVDAPDTSGRLIDDRFHFTVGAAGYESEPAVFNISIVKVVVSISTSGVKLEAGNTGFLLTQHALDVRHYGLVGVSDDDIRFFILTAPVHGNLFYGDTGLRISYGGSFTLAELRNNRIQYEVDLTRSTQPLHDHIELNAVIRDHYRSQPSTLNITYQPDTKSIQLTSGLVEVDEGGEVVITSDQLFAQTLLHNRFAFIITHQPTHGTLYIINPPNVGNLTTFTTQDILEHRLKYRHDGSETPQDFLAFTLHPISGAEEALISGVLNISIHLLNDHPPVRVVNQPFHLPRRGERLLTPHDIWYHDPDISDDDRELKFVRRGISNGDLLNATTLMKIFEFSQKDIASSGVLFRHRGRDFGRFVFWVKDGKHFATGLFVVVASPPYLRITNHSKLMVERSSSAAVTSNHISISTNVDGWPRNVGFSITSPPAHGNLVIGDSPVTTFTQADINHGNLIYRHDGSEGKRDIFHFDIRVGSTTAHGNVSVRIYLASEMLPPVLKRNEMIVVHQNSSVVLTRSTLRAHHPTTRTKDLAFTLTRPPVYGSVVVTTSPPSPNITTFTQWDINQGLVVYQQDGNISDDIVAPSDGFEFTVSNGMMSSMGEVHVEIIPSGIPLRCGNFSVREGGSRILISDYLGMHNEHYDADNINVRVVEQPMHGQLESARDTGVQLREFPLRLALAEFVYYVHDGSDTLYDSYKLQASTIDGSKTSRIMTSHITIIPYNDEAPYIVNNTGMEVWVNSTTTINEAQLTAMDPDTPPSVQYSILPPLNGHLVLSTNPHQQLHNFTQQQINDGQLLFVHQGSYTGGFTFQVGDGRNYGVKQIFIIRARPLVISISGSHTMPVFPGTTSALQPSVMHGSTNSGEGNSHGVTFHVSKPPRKGELVKLLP